MLFIQPQSLTTVDDLRAALQNAIRLEHATIPPYLTARATLKGTSEAVGFARDCIKDIVVEEMLHMTLACNILNAIGGHPVIADPSQIPTYPGRLPMGVAGGVEVHLRRFSKALVEDTFMKIEEPEEPLDIPTIEQPMDAEYEPMTIGQFYQRIRMRIDNEELFTGKPELQVPFGKDSLVTDVASAQHAIDIIVQQGEGTQQSPLNPKNVAAHYYQFQQFSKRMRIKPNPASPYDVSFDPTQPLVIDDTDDVIQMIDDPATVTYHEADTDAETLSKEADMAYSEMLRVLHMGFNGQPGKVHDAIGVMVGKFRKAVDDLLHQQLTAEAHTGLFAGPRFRYIP